MKNQFDRRSLLRIGVAGGTLAGAHSLLAPLGLAEKDFFGPPCDTRKVLVVFLRGGNDGLNALSPTGPAAVTNGVYSNGTMTGYADMRPDIHLYSNVSARPGAALPLVGVGGTQAFAELNPALAKVLPMYNAGHLSFLHRVGSEGMSRSHFADQRFWETLRPQPPATGGFNYAATNYHEGWVAKWAGLQGGSGFHAASLSTRQQQLCDSIAPQELQAHIRRLYEAPGVLSYTYDSPASRGTVMGSGANSFAAHLRTGLGDRANTTLHPTRTAADDRVRDVLRQTLSSESQATTSIGAYTPHMSPVYPVAATSAPVLPTDLPKSGGATEFGLRLQDAARLIKNSTARIVCVEYGSFDTHANQVYAAAPDHELGRQQEVLATLGQGMEAIYKDVILDPAAPPTLVLVVSEFGRTSDQNDSRGTDHAEGGLVMAMGTNLRTTTRQVFNFEHNPGNWQHMTPNDFTSAGPRHMGHKTDFRTVFEEAFVSWLCLNQPDVDALLPGYSMDKMSTTEPRYYNKLGYLL